jgi:Anti-sigma factor NepR
MSKSDAKDAKSPRNQQSVRSRARLREAIGSALKAHYDDLVRAPIPQKFHELLTQLEAGEGAASGGQGRADERR